MKALSASLLLFAVTACVAAGRTHAQQRHEFAEVHMGMPVRIILYAPDVSTAHTAARAAFRRIAELDDVFSDYRASSELRRLEQADTAWTTVSPPLFDLLRRALHIARLTGGAFDPTIGPVTALWRNARMRGAPPPRTALDSARRLVGWHELHLDTTQRAVRFGRAGMRLDLGGIAKGYILQQALATLAQHGSAAALLEAGGDIVVGAAPPGQPGWRIETPHAGAAFAARAATLTHAALATSGATSQYLHSDGVRYSHVVDPRTGAGVTEPTITRVLAPDAALADALATALGVLGPAPLAALLRHFPGVQVDTSR